MICGIDPGAKGGIAFLTPDGRLAEYARMPTKKAGSKNWVDGHALFNMLQIVRPKTVVIENVSSRPGQGVVSVFSFGMAFGVAVGVVEAYGPERLLMVAPQQWKKQMNLSSDKGASLDMASRLWRNGVDWSVKANDGIAEAALLAQWAIWHR